MYLYPLRFGVNIVGKHVGLLMADDAQAIDTVEVLVSVGLQRADGLGRLMAHGVQA